MSDFNRVALAEATSELVAADVGQNHVQASELPNLIAFVHAALGGLGKPAEPQVPAEPLTPAVSVRRSITDDSITSREDGRKLKSMKRYLAGLGMTPAEYRAKRGLPADDTMVAPAYAAKRSELAKSLGLGRRGAQDAVDAAPDVETRTPRRSRSPRTPRSPQAAAAGRPGPARSVVAAFTSQTARRSPHRVV